MVELRWSAIKASLSNLRLLSPIAKGEGVLQEEKAVSLKPRANRAWLLIHNPVCEPQNRSSLRRGWLSRPGDPGSVEIELGTAATGWRGRFEDGVLHLQKSGEFWPS